MAGAPTGAAGRGDVSAAAAALLALALRRPLPDAAGRGDVGVAAAALLALPGAPPREDVEGLCALARATDDGPAYRVAFEALFVLGARELCKCTGPDGVLALAADCFATAIELGMRGACAVVFGGWALVRVQPDCSSAKTGHSCPLINRSAAAALAG